MKICPFLKFSMGAYKSYSGMQLELDNGLVMDVNKTPSEKMVFEIDKSQRVNTDFGAVK